MTRWFSWSVSVGALFLSLAGCSADEPRPLQAAAQPDAALADGPAKDALVPEAAPADALHQDAPAVDAADASPSAWCDTPTGNLLEHGTFEEGMDGLAPAGWEVRNPALPAGDCMASGTAEQHVFLSEGPAGCSGHFLSIDARGKWDCYAIQRVSAYNSILGGHKYRIQAALRSKGNAPDGPTCPECAAAWFTIGVQWLDANDSFFGDVKNPKPADPSMNDHDWQVTSFEVDAPANATRILVWLSAHYPGRVDYDNISVVPL